MTRQTPISDHIAKRRSAHLGHILRRNNPIRDILYHIDSLLPKGRAKANILKLYEADLESYNIQNAVKTALVADLILIQ